MNGLRTKDFNKFADALADIRPAGTFADAQINLAVMTTWGSCVDAVAGVLGEYAAKDSVFSRGRWEQRVKGRKEEN